jgi:hypothetical protein
VKLAVNDERLDDSNDPNDSNDSNDSNDLVLLRPLDMIDDECLEWRTSRYQFQAELLLVTPSTTNTTTPRDLTRRRQDAKTIVVTFIIPSRHRSQFAIHDSRLD